MDALNHAAVSGLWELPGVMSRGWRRGITLLAVSWMLLIAALLLVRRSAGAFAEPLPAVYLLALAVVVGMTTWLARRSFVRLNLTEQSRASAAAHWLIARGPTLAIVLFGVAVSVPHSNWWAVSACWLIMLAADLGSLGLPRRNKWIPQRTAQLPAAVNVPAKAGLAAAVAEDELAHNVSQQITRWQDEAGVDTMSGLLRTSLAPGDRSGWLHVAFCPPFERLPELHVEQTVGPTARIKVAQLQTHGARFEYRLAEPCGEAALLAIEFTACESAGSAPTDGDRSD